MDNHYIISINAFSWVSEQIYSLESCDYTLDEVKHSIMFLAQKQNDAVLEAALLHNTEFQSDVSTLTADILQDIKNSSQEIFESDPLDVVPVTIAFSDEMVAHYSCLAMKAHGVFSLFPVKDIVLQFLSKNPTYAVEYINGTHTDTCVRDGAESYFLALYAEQETLTYKTDSEINKAIWVKYWTEQNQIVIPLDSALALYDALSQHKNYSGFVSHITANEFAHACASKPELTNLLFASFVKQYCLPFSVDRPKIIGKALFESGYKIDTNISMHEHIRLSLDSLSSDQEKQLMDLVGLGKNGLTELFFQQPALYLENLIKDRSWLPSRCLQRLLLR